MKSFISHRTSSAMLCALWAAGSLCSVQAAESGSSDPLSTFTLNPLVVTATRTPVELNKAPANISIITGKEIEEAHYTDLSQALRDVSDVYIGNYGTGIGYETSNNFYINGNNNIVWMVDGIIMNTTGVNAPVSAIKNLSNIERIEILKGSASALYGSSAVGGVINIITRQPAEGSQTSVRVLGGSYGQEQYSFSTEGAQDGWRYRANYQKDLMHDYKDAHGTEIPQHLNAESTSFMLGRKIDAHHDFSLYYDNYDADTMWSNSNKNLLLRNYGFVKMTSWRGVLNSEFGERWQNRFTLL